MTITIYISIQNLYLGVYLIAMLITGIVTWVKIIHKAGMRNAYVQEDVWRVRAEYYLGGGLMCAAIGLTWPAWVLMLTAGYVAKRLGRATPTAC